MNFLPILLWLQRPLLTSLCFLSKLDLLRHGGLQLRPGGCLLHCENLWIHLFRRGGLLLCRLRLGSLLHLGTLLSWLCLSPLSLHFHIDLALHPFPCTAFVPPISWTLVYSVWSIWNLLLGGGALSRSLAGVPVSFVRGHSIPDFYHTIKDLISHNPLPGLISTHCLHLCLIYPVCSPYISLVQFVILCEVLRVIAAILSLFPCFFRVLVLGPVTLPVFWINPLSVFALLLLFGLITCV